MLTLGTINTQITAEAFQSRDDLGSRRYLEIVLATSHQSRRSRYEPPEGYRGIWGVGTLNIPGDPWDVFYEIEDIPGTLVIS